MFTLRRHRAEVRVPGRQVSESRRFERPPGTSARREAATFLVVRVERSTTAHSSSCRAPCFLKKSSSLNNCSIAFNKKRKTDNANEKNKRIMNTDESGSINKAKFFAHRARYAPITSRVTQNGRESSEKRGKFEMTAK